MTTPKDKKPSLFGLFGPYRAWLGLLMFLTLLSNGLGLVLPRFIESGIDYYPQHLPELPRLIWPFVGVSVAILILGLFQGVLKSWLAEQVAFDLRKQLVARLAQQPYTTLQKLGTATLLTRLTSDVDAIKLFISQVIVAMASSLLLMIGASAILLWMNWKLALGVLATIPLLAFGFQMIFKQGRSLFGQSQAVTDALNRVINESILGAPLVRVLNAQTLEEDKFNTPNAESRDVGFKILRMFASLIPMINFMAGLGSLIILMLGGYFVIQNSMTLGELAAFNSYLMMLVFPILVMGFTSQQMARASASYKRIHPILTLPLPEEAPQVHTEKVRAIAAQDLHLTLDGKPVLKGISFDLKPGSHTAILGPTGAGKTLLVQLLTGLFAPDQGQVLYDGRPHSPQQRLLPPGLAMVFQDSVVFQLSLKENIAFGPDVDKADLDKAIESAELSEFIARLPQGLETEVSERGISLSGGQKQRLMLARALAQNPSVLLLDDFTARVDTATEARILDNLKQNYPELTLLSVTQKIESIQEFDHVLLLMEGELLAQGTHEALLKSSPEYMQIYQSQQSTDTYAN